MIDLGEGHRRALRRAAASRGLRSMEILGDVAESASRAPALVVVGTVGGEAHCLDRVRALCKTLRNIPLVLLAENLGAETAFALASLGVDELVSTLDPAASARCLAHASREPDDQLPELVGESPAMEALRRNVARIAGSASGVLITGETGTGKNLVARAIHRLSPRAGSRFVHVDCASLSESLIESELFGHQRGAFTGALAQRPGRFELAGDGTIFLDEIGELECFLQRKFLRVLEERQFERVGGSEPLPMRARVIAATSRDLERDISEGRFRADLFYRMRILHLRVAPLRERISDLPRLVESTLTRLSRRSQIPRPRVSSEFLERLMAHDWPGNVRELVHVVEAAFVRSSSGLLEARDVDTASGEYQSALSRCHASSASCEANAYGHGRETDERARLRHLLSETGGNVSRVARRLGMARSTLRYKIDRYGLGACIPQD